MAKVLHLHLDGYSDWVATSEKVIDLQEFTGEVCASHHTDGEATLVDLKECGYAISILPHSISLMGEEGGDIYIKMS